MSLGTDCSQSHRVCNVGLGTTQASGLSDRPNHLSSQTQFILPILATTIEITCYSDETCVSPNRAVLVIVVVIGQPV